MKQADKSTISSLSLYRRLLSYLGTLWFMFLLSIVGFALYASSNAMFADMFERIINLLNGDSISPAQRMAVPLTLLAIVALRGFGGFLGAYFMAYVANHVNHKMRCQLMECFLQLPTRYYDKNSAGHLLSTVTYNITQVNAAVSDSLAVIIREGLTVLVLLGYLLYKNWQLTLIFFAVTPLISLVVLYASKKFRKHSRRIQFSMGDLTQILSESLKGLKVIRTFGAEKQVNEKFQQASNLNLRQNLKLASTHAIATPVIQVVVASTLVFLVWLAMSPSALANISAGEFIAYITAAGLMLKPIRQLSKVNAAIQRGLAAAQSVFDLLDEEVEQNTGTYRAGRLEGRVEYRNVKFRYQGQQKLVLDAISFTVEPGRSIAIVGKSGSGKTTLVNLLPRFYELNGGEILIDGKRHAEFELHNLRSHIALVSQQVVLFNGSIRDNIAYGDLADVSDDAILNALEHANAMEFIQPLEHGIDTIVGDDGVLLSGGQRQRLAIARALLKDAPILILDEATSALDTESERHIQSALETLMKGRTTFVIAHRLSTVENADRILVMHKGRIAEQGSHDELLALGDHYARLHQVQFADE